MVWKIACQRLGKPESALRRVLWTARGCSHPQRMENSLAVHDTFRREVFGFVLSVKCCPYQGIQLFYSGGVPQL